MTISGTSVAERAARYAEYFERLTPSRLKELHRYFASDARFKDPFNDVSGIDAIRVVFQDMYDQCEEARFEVLNSAVAGRTAYLHWYFHFRLRRWRRGMWRRIEGVSRAVFNADGKVTEHVDYWDAAEQVYEEIPLLGRILRFVKRQLSAGRRSHGG